MNGPDFIIIGAMKSATTALHDALATHPRIFMTTPKEPNFFSDDAEFSKGPEYYSRLFAGAGQDQLKGESSTHYTKLPTYPQTSQRMTSMVPEALLIYVMRHPIDRLVSQYIHQWTEREISVSLERAVVDHPELTAYSQYGMQLRPYVKKFGADRILPVFHHDFARNPQTCVERVLNFLHIEGDGFNLQVHKSNESARRIRKHWLRDRLRQNPVSRKLIRTVIPTTARNAVNSFWQMKHRPVLTPETEHRLTKIFDEDLKQLESSFGIRVTCDSFRETSLVEVPS